MLEENGIEYFDTPPSKWGFYGPAIWIRNDDDYENARQLLLTQQQAFAQRAREEYQRETGYNPEAPLGERIAFTFRHLSRRKGPLLLLIFVLFLLYLYFSLFFGLFQPETTH